MKTPHFAQLLMPKPGLDIKLLMEFAFTLQDPKLMLERPGNNLLTNEILKSSYSINKVNDMRIPQM